MRFYVTIFQHIDRGDAASLPSLKGRVACDCIASLCLVCYALLQAGEQTAPQADWVDVEVDAIDGLRRFEACHPDFFFDHEAAQREILSLPASWNPPQEPQRLGRWN